MFFADHAADFTSIKGFNTAFNCDSSEPEVEKGAEMKLNLNSKRNRKVWIERNTPSCVSWEPEDALKWHRVSSVVLLQRGWWVGTTKHNRGVADAVHCERRARYILNGHETVIQVQNPTDTSEPRG
jgi:hypothetical protein